MKFIFSQILREEDPGAPSAGGAPAPAPAASADDPAKLTIGQRLSAALASKETLQAGIAQRDATIAAHDATLAALTKERDDAAAALTEANTRIAALEASEAEVEKALKASEAEAAGLKTVATTVEKKAQETVASLGFSAAQLPAAEEQDPDNVVPSSRAELEEAMGKLPTLQERAALLSRYDKAQAAAA